MTGASGLWVAMPAQKQVDRDGQPRLDANGKPIYSQIVEFRYRATADRFAAMVLNLVRREHPADLAEAAP
jgi:DNA-binding cell septation regulator SpoVG